MPTNRHGGRFARRLISCAICACALSSSPALAGPVTDPVGDFIPSFTGPKNGDLDVTKAEATFDGATFRLDATVNGPVGTTSTGLYVWGFDRGKGTARFGAIATGVNFDSVVIIDPNLKTVTVRDLITGAATTLPASAVTIVGNRISVVIPANLLTSQGVESAKYLVNLWPRSANGGNETISDFAPDNSDARLTLAFPTPLSASIETEQVFDDATDRFARVTRRLSEQRDGDSSRKLGGFFDLGARFGTRGTGDSLSRDPVSRIISGGIDYAPSENVVVGVGFAADHNRTKTDFGGKIVSDIYSPELYLGLRSGPAHLDAYAAYSIVRDSSRRILPIGTQLLVATARPRGDAFSLGTSVGYDVKAGKLTVTPLADLLYTRAHIDAYSEANDQDFGSALAARNRESLRLGLGGQVRYTSTTEWGSVSLHAKARYIAELGDRRDLLTFAYTAQPDVRFDLEGPRSGVDYAALETGLDVSTKGGLRAGVAYSPRIDNHGFIDHAATLRIGMAF